MDWYDTYTTWDDAYCEFERDRHRKKASKKTPKKANHKHTWEDVILRENITLPFGLGCDSVSYHAGKRCTICGKLSFGFESGEPVQVSENHRMQTPAGVFNMPEVLPEFRSLPMYEVKSIFNMKDERRQVVMIGD